MTGLQAGAALVPLNLPDWPQTTDGTPLVARCLLLEAGDTRLCLVSLTLIALTLADAATVRAQVAAATGLTVAQVLVNCTHVHSGPATLAPSSPAQAALVGRLAEAATQAARQAQATLVATRAARASAPLPGVSRVRRILRRDGTIHTLRRACPETWGWASDPATVGPEEPLDHRLTVLRFTDASGALRAAVLHFACHPLPDFTGWAAREVERQHPGAVCLLLNGCAGTVDTPFEQPLEGKLQGEQLPVLGARMAARARDLLARAAPFVAGPLGFATRVVRLPLDPRFVAAGGCGGEVWAPERATGYFDAPLQVLRLGDLALAAVPGEPHVGFGPHLEALSPCPWTRVVSLANGEVGYLLTEAMRQRGGYEAQPEYWGVVRGEGLQLVTEALLECLRELA